MARLGMVINLDRCIGCHACSVGCAVSRGLPADDRWSHVKEFSSGTFPDLEITYLPTLCMQCEKPLCMAACPTGATKIDEDGVVTVDADECIGCGSCKTACPYGARVILNSVSSNHGEVGPTEHEAHHFASHKAGIAEKCTFCTDRRELGEEPLCVKTCVANARVFGDLDDESSEAARLAAQGKALLESEGTAPAVYYLYSGKNDLDEVFYS